MFTMLTLHTHWLGLVAGDDDRHASLTRGKERPSLLLLAEQIELITLHECFSLKSIAKQMRQANF